MKQVVGGKKRNNRVTSRKWLLAGGAVLGAVLLGIIVCLVRICFFSDESSESLAERKENVKTEEVLTEREEEGVLLLSPSPTAVPTATQAPTVTPTATQAPTVTPSPTPSPTTIPSPTELPTATPAPTVTPTSIPSPTELLTATPSPTILPPEEAAFQIAVMENDTVCLERVRDTRATEIVIPGYIGEKRVVQVEAEIFTGCKALTTVRLRDDVEPEPELFIELVTAALRCMKLREIYLPAGYEQYLTEELHLDKVKGITVAKEDNSMVIRLQTSLLFLAPKVIELMQQYQ